MRSFEFVKSITALALFLILLATSLLSAQPAPPDNPVAALNSRLAQSLEHLDFQEDNFGYLKSILKTLHVSPDSQVLVFSKTSQQFDHISPAAPRAIYFNDDVTVGYVQGGTMLEFAFPDTQRGVAFYTLDTARADTPHFVSKYTECARCHASLGLMVTSSATVRDGTPVPMGTNKLFNTTDQRTPFAERWSGWYVTGTHGAQTHRGNAIAFLDDGSLGYGLPGTQNLKTLTGRIDTTRYLQPSSDIVALLTLEHQMEMTNLIVALRQQTLPQPDADTLAVSIHPPHTSIEDFLAYMLFLDEAPLAEPVNGLSTFAATFSARGPRDHNGRSLRDFDLHTRLFKYPLSYMVYSETFNSIPLQTRAVIYRRLYDIFTGKDQSPRFARLSPTDRQAMLEILRDTKENLPDYWHH